jgi:hypothetical protein
MTNGSCHTTTPAAVAAVDHTEARNDILGCFGRSDRSRLLLRDDISPASAT